MTEEHKPTASDETGDTTQRIEEPRTTPEEKTAPPAEDDAHRGNSLAEKRGRMVTAGILSALILSLLVVVVAAIFQLTSRILVKCPQDLSVNDPAPVLWEKIEVPRLGEQPVGLPENLLQQASLKAAAASAEEQGK